MKSIDYLHLFTAPKGTYLLYQGDVLGCYPNLNKEISYKVIVFKFIASEHKYLFESNVSINQREMTVIESYAEELIENTLSTINTHRAMNTISELNKQDIFTVCDDLTTSTKELNDQ